MFVLSLIRVDGTLCAQLTLFYQAMHGVSAKLELIRREIA